MAKSLSRPKRWNAAVAKGRDLLGQMESLQEQLASECFEELESLRNEYEEWQGNLPENLQNGTALSDKLETVVAMDFSWSAGDDLSTASDALDEAENADLPRGFGKD